MRIIWSAIWMGIVFLASIGIMVIGVTIGLLVGVIISRLNRPIESSMTWDEVPDTRMQVGPLRSDLPT